MLTTVHDPLHAEVEQLMADREAAFVALAKRSLDEPATPEEIANSCRDSGHTPAEFQALVAALWDRRTTRLQIVEAEKLVARRGEIQQHLAAENEILENASDRYARITGPLQNELAQCRDSQAQIGSLRSRLVNGCPDVELNAEAKFLEGAIQGAHAAVQAATRNLGDVRSEAKGLGQELSDPWPGRIARAKKAVDAAQKKLNELIEQRGENYRARLEF